MFLSPPPVKSVYKAPYGGFLKAAYLLLMSVSFIYLEPHSSIEWPLRSLSTYSRVTHTNQTCSSYTVTTEAGRWLFSARILTSCKQSREGCIGHLQVRSCWIWGPVHPWAAHIRSIHNCLQLSLRIFQDMIPHLSVDTKLCGHSVSSHNMCNPL